MSRNLVPSHSDRRRVHRAAGTWPSLCVATVLLVLSFPIDAGGARGGGDAQSREPSGGSSPFSASPSSSSGGGGSSSASSGSPSGGGGSSSASSGSPSGGGGSSSASSGSSSGGGSSSSASPRGSSGGGRTVSSAPRSPSSGGGTRATGAPTASSPTRGVSGDRSSGSPAGRTSAGTRTVTATGSRGGPGGTPGGGGKPGVGPGGGGGGGRHPGGGHARRPRGWYCPPTYYPPSPWYWGGPWSWWWGSYWGSYWGPGWGGVYVITESTDAGEYARIDTDVVPEEAEVYLDGTLIGQADDFDGFPDYLYLEPGKYRLEFRHPFYETISKEIEVEEGQTVRMNDRMKLLPGKKRLQVVHPKSAGTPLGRVFGKPAAQGAATGDDRTGRFDAQGGPGAGIDGEPLEVDLDGLDGLDASAPPPPPPAGAEAWRTAEPKAGGFAPADQGRLRFEIEPDDAAVYLDDRYVGTAEELGGLSRGLRVTPGRHTVTVVRPGYATKTVDVESSPGKAIDVVIELEK